MSGLRVIAAGFAPTVQDLGRPQVQHLGVPPSGALDPVALEIANALVGNPRDAAALELRVMGPTLEVEAESVRVALVGTVAALEVQGERGGPVDANRSVRFGRGTRFRIGGLSDTGVAYLAVEGGIEVPAVYGSRATYVRARIGGIDGRAVRDGDLVPLARDAVGARAEQKCGDMDWHARTGPIRVVLGPQDDFFSEESIRAFFETTYACSREADRMGIRLDGPALEHVKGHDIVSDGIVTGAIQVPGTGRPILLLADHQTTGGYPKLGTVISADVPRLGRLRPGDEVRFQQVAIAEAEAARSDLDAVTARTIDRFERAGAWLDEAALYRENLVSGVVGPGD
jgi:biotin-dependent carboxylase-like uncharacterized protein